jgi:lysophospholipase L1-like esterase
MKTYQSLIFILLAFLALDLNAQEWKHDWAYFSKYEKENTEVKKSGHQFNVVFMGNSITEGWKNAVPGFFEANKYLCRGISGQTTSQMLVRFRADVIDLQPKLVVILAGTNDIAENNGQITLENILGNIVSMCELAKAHGIKVILCSVVPATDYAWSPGKNPKEKIPELNKMIKEYAKSNKIPYVDYYSAMVDEQKGLKVEYSNDGVHPTLAGYEIMMPLVKKEIEKAL